MFRARTPPPRSPIANLRLEIEKLRRRRYGQRSERKERMRD
jgi:hypothetical protein